MANFVASHGTTPPYGLISYTGGNLNLTDTTRATVVGTNFLVYEPQPYNNNVYGGTPTLSTAGSYPITFTPTSASNEGTQYFTVTLPSDGLYRVTFHALVTVAYQGGTTTINPFVVYNDGVQSNTLALYNPNGTTSANTLSAAGETYQRSRVVRVGGGTRTLSLYTVYDQATSARTAGNAKVVFSVERISD